MVNLLEPLYVILTIEMKLVIIVEKNHFAEEDVLLLNNKKIKKGCNYHTYIYPLCGKKIS
jgi:hypothetical protein